MPAKVEKPYARKTLEIRRAVPCLTDFPLSSYQGVDRPSDANVDRAGASHTVDIAKTFIAGNACMSGRTGATSLSERASAFLDG
jgi:hypothetical protein